MGSSDRELAQLDDRECRELLAGHHFGRLALVDPMGRPTIVPVNYVFDGERIAIRSEPGAKLSAAALSYAAFEVDGTDEANREGWSVVVRGPAYDITDSVDEVSEIIRRLPIDSWAPGDKAHWIRIDAREVSGRRLG